MTIRELKIKSSIMSTDKKVAYMLQALGLGLLVLSDLFSWPIFWPVFGMACLTSGTCKLVYQLYKKPESKSPFIMVPPGDVFPNPSAATAEWIKSCRSLPKDNAANPVNETDR